jgi:hypothetical protein
MVSTAPFAEIFPAGHTADHAHLEVVPHPQDGVCGGRHAERSGSTRGLLEKLDAKAARTDEHATDVDLARFDAAW